MEDPQLTARLAELDAWHLHPHLSSPRFPLVIVRWEDATNVAEWSDLEEAQRFDSFSFDYRCTNVGYLIRDDDECVIVAARASGDLKAVGLVERIPRGMVLDVTVLGPIAGSCS